VEDFILFNTEKHRLAHRGEIPDGEWRSRGDRLTERWRRIAQQKKREFAERGAKYVGERILEETTYHHREPLAGEPCDEYYMTSGHYHRLADDDEVWWHPEYRPMD
jgi:hypothetical protein